MSVMSDIVTPMLVLISAVLDRWVSPITGNTLTDNGIYFTGAISSLILHLTQFLAEFAAILPGNLNSP